MLILILISVQYSQETIFGSEKGLIGQNPSSSGSHCPVKKFPPSKISDSLYTGGIPPTPYCYLENPDKNSVLKESCRVISATCSPPIIDLVWKFS